MITEIIEIIQFTLFKTPKIVVCDFFFTFSFNSNLEYISEMSKILREGKNCILLRSSIFEILVGTFQA